MNLRTQNPKELFSEDAWNFPKPSAIVNSNDEEVPSDLVENIFRKKKEDPTESTQSATQEFLQFIPVRGSELSSTFDAPSEYSRANESFLIDYSFHIPIQFKSTYEMLVTQRNEKMLRLDFENSIQTCHRILLLLGTFGNDNSLSLYEKGMLSYCEFCKDLSNLESLKKIIEEQKAILGKGHEITLYFANKLATFSSQIRDYPTAQYWFQFVSEGLKERKSSSNYCLIRLKVALFGNAESLILNRQYDEAIACLKDLLELLKTSFSLSYYCIEDILLVMLQLTGANWLGKKWIEAITWLQRADRLSTHFLVEEDYLRQKIHYYFELLQFKPLKSPEDAHVSYSRMTFIKACLFGFPNQFSFENILASFGYELLSVEDFDLVPTLLKEKAYALRELINMCVSEVPIVSNAYPELKNKVLQYAAVKLIENQLLPLFYRKESSFIKERLNFLSTISIWYDKRLMDGDIEQPLLEELISCLDKSLLAYSTCFLCDSGELQHLYMTEYLQLTDKMAINFKRQQKWENVLHCYQCLLHNQKIAKRPPQELGDTVIQIFLARCYLYRIYLGLILLLVLLLILKLRY